MGAISGVIALVCVAMLMGVPAATAGSPARGAATGSVPASSVATAPDDPGAGSDANAPAGLRQMTLGVSMLPDDSLSILDGFTNTMGGSAFRPAIWSVWSDWLGDNRAFPTGLMDSLAQRDILPMVFWQPDDPQHQHEPLVTYKKIARGDFDQYIHQWAHDAAAYGGPMIIRFAHEMDGSWFPWALSKFGNTHRSFVLAWRHIWQIFKGVGGEGATNVRFLWSPFSPGRWMNEPEKRIYPGDQYVDYVGFTGLNWATNERPWRSMKELYQKPVRELARITNKPIIVAEAGSVNRSVAGQSLKPDWISTGYPDVYAAFPNILAIVYFNVRILGQADWRLNVPFAALTAYREVSKDARFQGHLTWNLPHPPVVDPPAVSLQAQGKAKAPRVAVSWPDASVSGALAIYDLELRTDGVWSPVFLPSPVVTSTSVKLNARTPHRYTFRLRGRDVSDRVGHWEAGRQFSLMTTQESAPTVRLTGHFSSESVNKSSGGTVAWSNTKGDTAAFRFRGTSVAFVTTMGPGRGRAKVYLDGVMMEKLDLSAPRVKTGVIAFGMSVSPGLHELTIKVMGKGASGRVDIDAFLRMR